MSILAVEVAPLAVDVSFPNDCLHVRLADKREITVPLTWFPHLKNATAKQRKQWRLRRRNGHPLGRPRRRHFGREPSAFEIDILPLL